MTHVVFQIWSLSYKSGTSIVGKLTVFPQFSLLKTDMSVGLVKSCLHLHIHLHGGEKLF